MMSENELSEEREVRFLPRFSVRGVLLLVTVVCAYLSCWQATRRQAASLARQNPAASWEYGEEPDPSIYSPVPFVLGRDVTTVSAEGRFETRRRFMLWMFGPEFELPVETNHRRSGHH